MTEMKNKIKGLFLFALLVGVGGILLAPFSLWNFAIVAVILIVLSSEED